MDANNYLILSTYYVLSTMLSALCMLDTYNSSTAQSNSAATFKFQFKFQFDLIKVKQN